MPAWLAVAAALAGRMVEAREMADLHRDATRKAWVGEEPWSESGSVEWFISVNRWLEGRERAVMMDGLAKAGLL